MFLMRYQQFVSHAYCGAAGLVSKMVSQKKRRHFENWPRGPAVSMRSELLVAHEKHGQLPLLTVYVVPV
jgi:hypothetical protein